MCIGNSSRLHSTYRDPLVSVPQHRDHSPWHLAGQEVVKPVAHDIHNVHIQKGVQAYGVFQPIDELLGLSPLANLHINERSVLSQSQLRSCLAFAKLSIYKLDTSNGCQAKPVNKLLLGLFEDANLHSTGSCAV